MCERDVAKFSAPDVYALPGANPAVGLRGFLFGFKAYGLTLLI